MMNMNNNNQDQPSPKAAAQDDDQDDLFEAKVIKRQQGKIHTIYTNCMYKKPKPVRFIDSEISSSLPFQKLVYFNVWYSMLHFYINVVTAIYRFQVFDKDTYEYLRMIFVFIPWGVVEYFRISNGYTGNIKESFPEVISFMLQTFLQIILNGVLLSSLFKRKLPIESPVLQIQMVFNIMELIYCIKTIRKLQKAQNALFFWKSPYNKKKVAKKDQIIREFEESKKRIQEREFETKSRHNRFNRQELEQERLLDDNLRDTDEHQDNNFYQTGGGFGPGGYNNRPR